MKKAYLLGALIAIATLPQTAQAQGFLDSINNVVNKVDQAITSSERAQNSVDRVMDKIPEGSDNGDQATSAPTESAPQYAQPAAGNIQPLTAQEKMIIKQSRLSNDPELNAMADEILARFE